MSEYLRTLGADPLPPEASVELTVDARLAQVNDQLVEVLRHQAEEESHRKWTLLFTIGGALFAAVRLGIIALPHVRRRHALGELAGNPGRRRRR